ncbi:MAG TPA: type II toxin-antitoxin system RelE/ParE family toxin [Polyangiaceae bacterium]
MTLVVRPLAEREIRAAARYYAKAAGPRLREAFLTELDEAFASIIGAPTAFPVVEGGIRGALLSRFPYRVYYVVEDEDVFVIACLHARRRPGLYRGR